MTCYAKLSNKSKIWHILKHYYAGLWWTKCGIMVNSHDMPNLPDLEGYVLTRDGISAIVYEPTAHKPLCKRCDKARENAND